MGEYLQVNHSYQTILLGTKIKTTPCYVWYLLSYVFCLLLLCTWEPGNGNNLDAIQLVHGEPSGGSGTQWDRIQLSAKAVSLLNLDCRWGFSAAAELVTQTERLHSHHQYLLITRLLRLCQGPLQGPCSGTIPVCDIWGFTTGNGTSIGLRRS